jgi:transposase InsO family protein
LCFSEFGLSQELCEFSNLNRSYSWGRLQTEITEINEQGRKLYLSPVLNLFNQEIISYKMSERSDFKSDMSVVQSAVKKIKSRGDLILHSYEGGISNESVSK